MLNGGRVVIATKNAGKVKEFASLLEPRGVRVGSLLDVRQAPDIVEDGTTFAENAMIKAKTAAEFLGVPVLADDSGLRVEALHDEPGVYSARYAGEHATDSENNEKLLRELSRLGPPVPLTSLRGGETASAVAGGAEEGRSAGLYSRAEFVCALALYDPETGKTLQVEGTCPGFILSEPRGGCGFGYDPLFYLPEYGRTMAELSPEEKNRISHRAVAFRKLLQALD